MHYELISSDIVIDSETYTTYGIKGDNISFDDVSLDKSKVEEMIARINREQLEECHLVEFISDELIR